jgi:hypothetical protein
MSVVVLRDDIFEVTATLAVPGVDNDDGSVTFPLTYGYVLTGSECVELVDITPLIPFTVQEVTARFRAIKTGACRLSFFLYITDFPPTSGLFVKAVDVKVESSLSSVQMMPWVMLFVAVFVVCMIAIVVMSNKTISKVIRQLNGSGIEEI